MLVYVGTMGTQDGVDLLLESIEYLNRARGRNDVLYALPEGSKSAGGAALYAEGNDPPDFAEKTAQLLDSKSLREQLGMVGRKRIVEGLNWGNERQTLLKAYQALLPNSVPSVLGTRRGSNNLPSSSDPIAEGRSEAENPVEGSI